MRTLRLLLIPAILAGALTAPASAAEPATNAPPSLRSRVFNLVSRVENLAGTERVSQSDTETTYTLQAEVLFAKDSAAISPQAKQKIDAIARKIAQAKPAKPVEVIGYTDNLGSSQHGLTLSRERANAVKKVLQGNPDLAGVTFTAKGLGEARPIGDNDVEIGRRKNRRVELVVPAN